MYRYEFVSVEKTAIMLRDDSILKDKRKNSYEQVL